MLRESLTDSWSFFKAHAVSLSKIIFPILIPLELFTYLYESYFISEDFVAWEYLLPFIVWLLVYPIYAIGVVFYVARSVSGDSLNTQSCWRLGTMFWLPYLIMSIVMGLATLLGFVFLIIPGIIIAVRYAFAAFDLLLNQSKPFDALGNSWHATKDHFWTLLWGYLIITLAMYVPLFIISSLFGEATASSQIFTSVANVFFALIGTIYTIFSYRVYDQASQSD